MKFLNNSEWDSTLFKIPFYNVKTDNIDFSELSEELRTLKEGTFVQAKIPLTDIKTINSLEKCNFELADVWVDLKLRDISKIKLKETSYTFKNADHNDLDQILTWGSSLFENSRFNSDKNFSSDKNIRLHEIWIENAILGKHDDNCLCLFDDSKVIAFCTTKTIDGNSRIGLFGINPDYQGRGLSKQLLSEVINYLVENNAINSLNVATQAINTNAISAYQKSGFYVKEMQAWLHYWN